MSDKRTILVIGATGAQGIAVIKALIAPNSINKGFKVRALTRDPENARAKELLKLGNVELFKGDIHDLSSVEAAMKDVYGVFVNIDSFTVGDEKELHLGITIFELAKQVGTVKHWVWSSLDYFLKKTKYNPKYRADHYYAKGRVAEWLKSQESEPESMIWSALTTGPYMESLLSPFGFGPITKRKDGTYVFAAPIGKGHVPMIALSDLGYHARYLFDHPVEYSAKDLKIATEMVTWPHLVDTFTKFTGKPAVFLDVSIEQHWDLRTGVDRPLALDFIGVEGSEKKITFRENFTGWWNMYHDDVIERDMEMLRRIHPNGLTLESWMREVGYDGDKYVSLLKLNEDSKGKLGVDFEKASRL